MTQFEISVKIKAKFDFVPANYTGVDELLTDGKLDINKVLAYEVEAVKDDPYAFFESSDFDGEPEGKIIDETELTPGGTVITDEDDGS